MKDTVKAVIGKGEHPEQKIATRIAIESWGWQVLDADPALGGPPPALLDIDVKIQFKGDNPDLIYAYVVTVSWSKDNKL